MEVWKLNRQVSRVPAGVPLRIQADAPFLLHWTTDEWTHAMDAVSGATGIGIYYADIPVPAQQTAPIRFTFLWAENNKWEVQDYAVEIEPAEAPPGRPEGKRNAKESSQKRRGIHA